MGYFGLIHFNRGLPYALVTASIGEQTACSCAKGVNGAAVVYVPLIMVSSFAAGKYGGVSTVVSSIGGSTTVGAIRCIAQRSTNRVGADD